jgi:hypothetical protein
MTKQDLWNEHLEFYRELVTKYKWQLESMIELIQLFDKVGICEKYFPSNSHESLGLSTVDNYEQRLSLPMVYITYQPRKNTFKLTFQKGQGTTVNEEDCGATVNALTISKIEQWLSDTN